MTTNLDSAASSSLTPVTVDRIMLACLYQDGEDRTGSVIVDGVMRKYGFHPQRLSEHAAEIGVLLDQLPEQFHEASGGGWSFLNGCTDQAGKLWTGDQTIVEALFALGMAIGAVDCQLPREAWHLLPGGVPYYMIKSVWSTADLHREEVHDG